MNETNVIPDPAPAPEPTKVRTSCGEAKPLSAYRLRHKGKPQRQTYCGDCRNEKLRQQTKKCQAHALKRGINLARIIHRVG